MHDLIFHSQEEFDEYVRRALEESEREAAEPNVTWEEFREQVEAYFYEMERRASSKSA